MTVADGAPPQELEHFRQGEGVFIDGDAILGEEVLDVGVEVAVDRVGDGGAVTVGVGGTGVGGGVALGVTFACEGFFVGGAFSAFVTCPERLVGRGLGFVFEEVG